jgi:hypothetical protein
LVKASAGKGLKRRRKWTTPSVEIAKEKIKKDEEEFLIDELAHLIYTFAVNQAPTVSSKLSKEVSNIEVEAA